MSSDQYVPTDAEVREAIDEWMWSRRMWRRELVDADGEELERYIARVKRDAARAAMLAFVEEAERYRDLRDASDDRHSAQDVDGWWYVISAADEHIDEFHPDPEEDPR